MTAEQISTLRRFICPQQMAVMLAGCKGEEGAYFRDKIAEYAERIATMPQTYQQEELGDQAIVYLHYFHGGADWYITERDMGDGEAQIDLVRSPSMPAQHQAFGLADLFGDGGELGYISIVELVRAGVDFDLHWKPRTLAEVQAKRKAA